MTLTGPACVSRLAKLMIGISLPTQAQSLPELVRMADKLKSITSPTLRESMFLSPEYR
jgi:hypothetical protein